MKRKFTAIFFLSLALILAVTVFAACGDKNETPPEENGAVVTFVAVDGTNWDANVTIAEKTYNLSLELDKDNTFDLKGTCKGKASTGGGPGGGFPGGGFPGGGQTETEEPEEDPDEGRTDWTEYDFAIDGTWSEDKGYGYVLKFNDGENTEIHVNFDTISGRHYFYYYISPTIAGEKADDTLVRMEARDSAYRKNLVSDYKIYEERTCTYMFRGGQEGGSGNLASGYVYLMPGGSLVSLSGTSNSLTYTAVGNWSENKEEHVISMNINGTDYKTDAYCDIPGREGYRMQYSVSSFGGSSSMTLYASCDTSKYTWDLYTTEDFEGQVVHKLEGKEYDLVLTEKGFARVENKSGEVTVSTRYSESDGNYTFTETSYGTISAQTEGTTVTITTDLTVKSGSGPFAQTIEINETYTLDLSV